MQAPTSQKSDFEPAPEGNQVGILVGLYHLGPQEHSYKGESKMRDEVRVVFELIDTKAKFGDSEEEKPFLVAKSGAYSMNEKSFLRKVVEACLGKKMRDDEAERFTLEEVAGKACLVEVGHYDSGGIIRAGINNVSALPRGMKVSERVNPVTVFDVTNYTDEQFEALPDWMKEKVQKSGFKSVGAATGQDEIASHDIPF